MLLGQIDEAAAIIKKSADHSWEAMMVAFFCVAVVAMLVWLMRAWSGDAHDREERMAKRIDDLEMFTRDTLLEALQDNSRALIELTSTLRTKPCLLTLDADVREGEPARRRPAGRE